MSANVQIKSQPKWKSYLRFVLRSPRPRPYWRQRFEDQVDVHPAYLGDDGFGSGFIDSIVLLFMGSLFVAALPYLVAQIFFSPGFFEVGLAAPIGRAFSAVCMATGQCDLRYLMSGAVVGITVLALVLMLISVPAREGGSAGHEELADHITSEVSNVVGAVDDRLVRLRADLVTTGALPLSDEEREEQREDEALDVARASNPFPGWIGIAGGVWVSLIVLVAAWVQYGLVGAIVRAFFIWMGALIVTQLLLDYDLWVRLKRPDRRPVRSNVSRMIRQVKGLSHGDQMQFIERMGAHYGQGIRPVSMEAMAEFVLRAPASERAAYYKQLAEQMHLLAVKIESGQAETQVPV